jgi:hypothetical protein
VRVVDSKRESPEGHIQFTSRYTLGGDGKSLNVATRFTGPQGDSDMKFYLISRAGTLRTYGSAPGLDSRKKAGSS